MNDATVRVLAGIACAVVAVIAARTSRSIDGGRLLFRDVHPLAFWGFVVFACALATALSASGLIHLMQ